MPLVWRIVWRLGPERFPMWVRKRWASAWVYGYLQWKRAGYPE
jgi:hypothetical protein